MAPAQSARSSITRRHGVLCREIGKDDGAVTAIRSGKRFLGQGLGLGVLRELQVRVNCEICRVIVVGLNLEADPFDAIDSSHIPTIE